MCESSFFTSSMVMVKNLAKHSCSSSAYFYRTLEMTHRFSAAKSVDVHGLVRFLSSTNSIF